MLRFDHVDVRGLRLRWAISGNAGAPGPRSLIILNGRTEFIEKYEEAYAWLIGRGFAIATMDWRGQGGSARLLNDPQKGHVGDFAEYQADLRAFLALLEDRLPRPWFALAHSMGGHNLVRYLIEVPDAVDACVLSAPMLDLRIKGLTRLLGGWLIQGGAMLGLARAYAPGHGPHMGAVEQFEDNVLTTDEARFRALQSFLAAHPELRVAGATWGWVRQALRSIARINAPGELERIKIPVLLGQPLDDQVVCLEAQNAMARRCASTRLLPFEGARHEMLIERDAIRSAFLGEIDRFLRP